VARHPSESEEYLIARVLAYLLEFAEGIEFSRGVSDPAEPTTAIHCPGQRMSMTTVRRNR